MSSEDVRSRTSLSVRAENVLEDPTGPTIERPSQEPRVSTRGSLFLPTNNSGGPAVRPLRERPPLQRFPNLALVDSKGEVSQADPAARQAALSRQLRNPYSLTTQFETLSNIENFKDHH